MLLTVNLILRRLCKSDSEDDEEEEDHEAVSVSSEELLFEHHACFAHTIQLDGLKKAGQLNTVIKKCTKIVSFTRRSIVAADTLEGEKRLQADNVTRWNSQLKMIRSVLSIPASKLSEEETIPTLTAHDRNLLQDIFTPFKEATDFVQVECVPSAGYVLPCVGFKIPLPIC